MSRWGFIVAMFLIASQNSYATSLPVVSTVTGGPEVEGNPNDVETKNDLGEPLSVRIGVQLTGFQKLVSIKNGKRLVRFQPLKELSHTLRSRLNKKNHFFVGDYHIESRPMRWQQDSQQYGVRLTINRRYGAFGQLEEVIGSVDLQGVLGDRQGNVFVLYGAAKKRFRDKFGNPVLDIVAGYKPAPKNNVTSPKTSQAQPVPKVRRSKRNSALPTPGKNRKRF